ncbi:MAG: permease-like cell division protein FtsX [Candidatus Atribacteria bacterium]|nr:permease-like cell division protein FtsX [Candidatus Atribacteria bacterium]MCD6350115.1 permease-like cell division protein FtsX [Candidatus Atribacteria bacterium]
MSNRKGVIRRRWFQFNLVWVSIFLVQLLFNFFLVSIAGLQELKEGWTQNFVIKAYFKSEVQQEEAKKWLTKINSFPQVRKVVLVTPQEAERRFLKSLGFAREDFPLEDNPFPYALEITCNTLEEVVPLTEYLSGLEVFDEVLSGASQAQNFLYFYWVLLLTGGGLSVLMLVFAVLMVSNAVSSVLWLRREEVELWRRMGASLKFIRKPFFLFGLGGSLMGSTFALIVSVVFWKAFLHFLAEFLPFLPLLQFKDVALIFLVSDVLFGLLVGLSGSWLGFRKGLRGVGY